MFYFFLKVFQFAGRKIDEIQFNQFNKQKNKAYEAHISNFYGRCYHSNYEL